MVGDSDDDGGTLFRTAMVVQRKASGESGNL
jgi:hypothetical protein